MWLDIYMETNPTTETIINAINPALAPWNTAASEIGTGGGCTAIAIDVPGGGEILITDAEDPSAPDATTTHMLVCLYPEGTTEATREAIIPVMDLGTLSFTLDAFLLGQ